MVESIKIALKSKAVRKKLIITFFMICLFRWGSVLPVIGVNTKLISEMVNNNSLLGLYNMFSGGAFSHFSLFALGINPYITASIIMQLVVAGFEGLKELQKSGEEGRRMIGRYTRWLTLILSIVQALGVTLGIIRPALKSSSPIMIAGIVVTLVAGSMIVMWMADRITEKGIGNGSSDLIFIGIISRIPSDGVHIYNKLITKGISYTAFWVLIAVIILTFIGVTLIAESYLKIRVEYARLRLPGSKDSDDYIPLRVMQSNVMPIIFASSLLALPQTFALFSSKHTQGIIHNMFNLNTEQGFWTYRVVEILLIILFSYFYNTVSFNVSDITKNMKNSGSFIPGIRTGDETERYLKVVSSRLTIVGAIFLSIMALIPALVTHYLHIPLSFGGTSLLIVVGVALEIRRNLESNSLVNSYKSFYNYE